MALTIILSGGPADGRRVAIPNDVPPSLYFIPLAAPLAFSFDLKDMAEASATRLAEYEPVYEYGWPSRTDDGSIRYRHRGTPEPLHPGQRRPSPTLEELAELVRDPLPSAYPSNEAHLLACRTRHSLRRDARLNPEEQAVWHAVAWADMMGAVEERRRNRPLP